MGGTHQGYQLLAHLLDIGVHEGMVELDLGRQLRLGDREPTLDHFRRFRASLGESPDQFLPRWRTKEHQQRPGNTSANLPSAGQIDLEQHALAEREARDNRCQRRAVQVAVELGPFEKLPSCDPSFEFGPADEVVMHALHFTRPWEPGRR